VIHTRRDLPRHNKNKKNNKNETCAGCHCHGQDASAVTAAVGTNAILVTRQIVPNRLDYNK
jgi:hypothetical protein